MDYLCVKTAVIEHFECIEEGFWKRFRSVKPQNAGKVPRFITRLINLLNRQVDLSSTKPTYEGVCDLVLSEQFLACCGCI